MNLSNCYDNLKLASITQICRRIFKKLTFHFYCLKPYNFVELLMEGEKSRIAEENFFKIKILQNINSYDETEKLMA